ncbi:MAG: MFS transporter [Gammaproteobacteria bacterium]|nr:MFS transporter [Gammaproteobacteria bacterium]MCP5417351.1 MFS transporter [Chromatiaceae bacterium]
MIFLGFSAGLPFLLVFSTLSAWLTDAGLSRTLIGYFSWIGITYSIKVFWAPVIDRLPLPYLTALLGKRRSWMLVAQIGIAVGLVGMASADVQRETTQVALFALVVAFCSATQDVTIDAYRIEAVDKRLQGAMAATYVFGYRLALLAAGAGAFYLAAFSSWPVAYLGMASLMLIGMVATLVVSEPDRSVSTATRELEVRVESLVGIRNPRQGRWSRFTAWFSDAVISPFVEFFNRNGRSALVILLLIGLYKVSDITMGVMANPFYLDLGFSKIQIADVTKIFGFFMTIAGAALGGLLVVRYGIMRPLLLGAVMVALTNLLFALLAVTPADLRLLALVVSADNLSGGIATSVFVAYLSSLTNSAYTATQYALFSSLMTLPAKLLGGFSGIIVDGYGYLWFFVYAAATGIPAILLVLFLSSDRADMLSSAPVKGGS